MPSVSAVVAVPALIPVFRYGKMMFPVVPVPAATAVSLAGRPGRLPGGRLLDDPHHVVAIHHYPHGVVKRPRGPRQASSIGRLRRHPAGFSRSAVTMPKTGLVPDVAPPKTPPWMLIGTLLLSVAPDATDTGTWRVLPEQPSTAPKVKSASLEDTDQSAQLAKL